MVNLLGAIGTGATIAITIKAIDEFSNTFGKAGKGISTLEKVGTVAVTSIAAVGTALIGVGVSSIKASADMEQTRIAFTSMLGSAEKANILLKDIFEFAKKTPFEVEGLTKASKQLIAYGSSADEVLGELKTLGDISATIGMDKLPNLIRAFGQVRAKTELSGEELRQFTETGIGLIPELEKVTGYSAAQITDQTKNLGISFEQVKQALENMTQEGGVAFNAMASQMDSAQGKFSNINDAIYQMKLQIGDALLPIVSDFADTLLNEVLPAMQPMIPTIQEFLKNVLNLLPPLTTLVVNLLPIMNVVVKSLSWAVEKMNLGIEAIQFSFEGWKLLIQDVISLVKILWDWLVKIIDPLGMVSKSIGIVKGIFSVGKKVTGVGDAIIRPNGEIIRTHPQDTLIATKTPGNLGGGLTVYITGNNIYGTDPDDIAQAIQEKLNTMILT